MKTLSLRLFLAAVTALSVAACGSTDDTDYDGSIDPNPTPEATPDVTPEPTPIPNTRPEAPDFSLSHDVAKPADVVTIDLALVDADGDLVTSNLTAVLDLGDDELDISGNLTKVSDAQWQFVAPITEAELGTVRFRAQATDARGGVSDLSESNDLTIDNRVDVTPDHPLDVCRWAKAGCKIEFNADNLKLDVTVPDPTIYIPDQLRGALFTVPSTDFIAAVDLQVNDMVTKWSLADSNLPSIQVTVGTDEIGYGYALEIYPVVVSGSRPESMLIRWNWRVRALASNGMTKENLLAGTILASGNLSYAAPSHIEASIRDGILRFTIGNVTTPSIAATNLAGTDLGFTARATEVTFTNTAATMKP